jgi:hypothetical protein
MKFRLTPLNVITALAFAFFVASFFQNASASQTFNINFFYSFLIGALALVSFISDLIFRFTLKDLKRIWLIETFFIVFTVILILILQK